MRRVTVHIDRLTLAGVPRAEAEALAAGLADELRRTIAVADGLPSWAEARNGAARLDGGPVDLGAGVRPADLGRHVARSVLTAKARR